MEVDVRLTEDEYAKHDPWVYARAVLEAVEPGAGSHCIQIEPADYGVRYRHYRLGVTINVTYVDDDEWSRPDQELLIRLITAP